MSITSTIAECLLCKYKYSDDRRERERLRRQEGRQYALMASTFAITSLEYTSLSLAVMSMQHAIGTNKILISETKTAAIVTGVAACRDDIPIITPVMMGLHLSSQVW